jgi:RNA polymerase sigma-70 factor (ECF subfamily)
MRRILSAISSNKMERTMRLSGWRQKGTGRPALFLDSSQEETPPSVLAPTLATAILSDCIDSQKSSSRQSDVTGGGKLVYAVRDSTQSEESASDELLLRRVAEGDKAAMHIMFARHRTRVLRFIQRTVRNPGIAEDLVSQVFLDVWRSANRFENRARVSTWLLSIARYKAINSLRERTHENIDRDDVREIVDADDTPEVALDRKQTNGILRECIARLSPAHREIIELVYYRENSPAEVSAMLDIPLATAKSRMFYARKRLARSLVSAGLEAADVQTLMSAKC